MPDVSVIVPAAGAGKRFGGKRNKIFEKIANQPIFLRTLEAFTNRDDVLQVLLVISPEDMDEVKEKYSGHLGLMSVSIVAGGDTRTQSVRNALAMVSDDAKLIAVHDAARPCISQVWIDAVFDRARRTAAAILAVPIHGTMKLSDESGIITETLEKRNIYEAQTPQVFSAEILKKAYQSDTPATDDAALVEQSGHPVSLVPSDARNIKITTPQDLAFARAIFNTLPKPKEKLPFHPFQDAQW